MILSVNFLNLVIIIYVAKILYKASAGRKGLSWPHHARGAHPFPSSSLIMTLVMVCFTAVTFYFANTDKIRMFLLLKFLLFFTFF